MSNTEDPGEEEASFHLTLAERLLIETREELARADTKAQILLAATGVIVGVVLSGIIAGNWSPEDLKCVSTIMWWAGSTSAALGLLALGWAIFPRIKSQASDRIGFFSDVRRFADSEELRRAIDREARRGDRDVDQLRVLSVVVHTKYRSIQFSIVALGVAVALCVSAVMVG